MLVKILCFLRGYVEIIVKSRFAERFINLCTGRGIYLWDIRRTGRFEADMKMSTRAFSKIRPIAKKTHSHIHIRRKCGLPVILHRYKRRYFLLYGLFAASCLIFAASQFIWSVEIVGNETVSSEQILSVLDEIGLKKGCLKYGFDARDLKNNALMRLDRLSWLWVDIKGSRAIVSVSEKRVAPEMHTSSAPCDIVAAKSGVVRKVIARQGQAAVEEGQTVMEGELLISGIMKSERIAPRCLHADGEVYARTWHEESEICSLIEEVHAPTGHRKSKSTLCLFGLDINLFINPLPSYKSYNTSEATHDWVIFGLYTGISLKSTTYSEVDISYRQISEDEAVSKILPMLEKRLAEGADKNALFISQSVSRSKADGQSIRVTLTAEYTEQIGTEKPIGNIAAPAQDGNMQ